MKKNTTSKKGITTIYDIARELNVSGSTVSRALRDRPDISKDLVEKVKATAKKLNYKPNLLAQSLKERRTKLLGVIIPDVLSPFYMSVLNGIEELAFRKGYHIITSKTNESYQREVMHIQSLTGQVDGMLICLSHETKNYDHFKLIKQQSIPHVFFERVPEKINANKVVMNDEAIALSITEHLFKTGYKRIGLITGGLHLNTCQNHIKGYKEALIRQNIKPDDELIVTAGLSFQQGQSGFQKLMRLQNHPDAIFAAGEQLVLAVYSEAAKMGLKISTDIGLVGLSDNPILSYLTPSISCVGQKGFEMGSMVAQICIDEIEHAGSSKKNRTEMLSNNLIVRQSSQKLSETEIASASNKFTNSKYSEEPLVYIY